MKAKAAWVAAPFAIALLLFQEMFVHWSNTGFGDYQYFHHAWELGRVAWSRYGELPLYNPFQCGGIPEWGDAQTQTFHPLFFVSFLTGTTFALKLFVLTHAAAGISGMYLYARRALSLPPIPSAVSAIAWAGSGFFAWHCGTGHGGFVAFWLLPWLLLSWRAAVQDLRFSVAVAGVLLLALLAGGAYVFPFFLIVLAFEASVLWLRERRHRETVLAILGSAVLTILVGAFRVLPVLDELREFPRTGLAGDRLSAWELWHILTTATPDPGLVGHPYGWPEYGSYVGTGILLFAAAGVVLALRTRRELVIGMLLFGAFMLGEVGRFAPWSLLTRLPVYSSLRVPTRFTFAFLFYVTLLAGLAFTKLMETRWFRDRQKIASVVLAAILVVPVVVRHEQALHGRWSEPAIKMGPVAEHFHLVNVSPKPWERGPFPPPASFPQLNVGTGYCYTGMGYFPAAGLWAGDTPQARVLSGGRVLGSGRTTREIWADVDMTQPGRVVFNQTWAPGFRPSEGRVVESRGRLALLVEPGKRRVSARYEPGSLYWAGALSILGVAFALLMSRRRFELLSSFRVSAPALLLAILVVLLGYRRALAAAAPKPSRWQARATASASVEARLNDWYEPARAIDGNPKSEWLLPDGRAGWLDLELDPPRHVNGVTLLDARNRPYANRQSRGIRVDLLRGGKVVRSTTLELEHEDSPRWVDVSLAADDVEHVRITVESWYRKGGGLAEVEVF
ncbi:MAG: hypothetical protein KC776_13820 [Myxococcales bacterium]|nr:hypothetical protein [Myxococcales bacterium]